MVDCSIGYWCVCCVVFVFFGGVVWMVVCFWCLFVVCVWFGGIGFVGD